MPAIREEMRVSEKLSPTIIGPTLKTATEILDSAYSKRTREKQEVRRRGHVVVESLPYVTPAMLSRTFQKVTIKKHTHKNKTKNTMPWIPVSSN